MPVRSCQTRRNDLIDRRPFDRSVRGGPTYDRFISLETPFSAWNGNRPLLTVRVPVKRTVLHRVLPETDTQRRDDLIDRDRAWTPCNLHFTRKNGWATA